MLLLTCHLVPVQKQLLLLNNNKLILFAINLRSEHKYYTLERIEIEIHSGTSQDIYSTKCIKTLLKKKTINNKV